MRDFPADLQADATAAKCPEAGKGNGSSLKAALLQAILLCLLLILSLFFLFFFLPSFFFLLPSSSLLPSSFQIEVATK